MSDYNQTLPSPQASGDLSSGQYHIVRYIGADRVFLASSAGALENCGVLTNLPQNDEAASIVNYGPTKVYVGSAVSANDLFTSNGSGRAITAASGYCAMGRVLTAGSPGDIVPCVVFPVVQLAR